MTEDFFKNRKILIISPEPWDHDHVSKHHYAIMLANNNNVIFLNPPGREDVQCFTKYPNLRTIDYVPKFRGLNRLPLFLRKRFEKREVSHVMKIADTPIDIVFTFDPYRFQFPAQFGARYNIYFSADWHHDRHLERLLCSQVHLVLSPSTVLLDEIDTTTRKLFVNHAVADHFLEDRSMAELPGKGRTKVGYVGNLESKYLDYSLFSRVVASNPDCDFILVGNAGARARTLLGMHENVHFLGRKENSEIPGIINACDILLLCYDTEKFRLEASNSHKVLEYLASGNVVVSTKLMEYADRPDLVISPDRKDQLPELLKKIAGNISFFNREECKEKRIGFAQDHTYRCQIKRIGETIAKMSPKITS